MSDLSTFLTKKYGGNNKVGYANEEKYNDEIINYMMYIEPDFKNKIIEKAKELIETDKYAKNDCRDLVAKMLKENYVNKDKIDIMSYILDYIRENVFTINLRPNFDVLVDNNFLTTLLELNNDKCKLGMNDNDKIIEELVTTFLKEIKVENDKQYEPKFFPGNDNNKAEFYYQIYSKIENYFKANPEEGIYCCFCDKGCCHSVTSGFHDFQEINLKQLPSYGYFKIFKNNKRKRRKKRRRKK